LKHGSSPLLLVLSLVPSFSGHTLAVDDESKERCAGVPRAKSSEEDTEGLVLPGGFVVTDDLRDSDEPRPMMEAVDLSDTSVIATLMSDEELPESICVEFLREGLVSGKGKGMSQGYTSSHIEEDPAVADILPVFFFGTSDCVAVSGDTAGTSVAESQGQTSSLGISATGFFSACFDPSSAEDPPNSDSRERCGPYLAMEVKFVLDPRQMWCNMLVRQGCVYELSVIKFAVARLILFYWSLKHPIVLLDKAQINLDLVLVWEALIYFNLSIDQAPKDLKVRKINALINSGYFEENIIFSHCLYASLRLALHFSTLYVNTFASLFEKIAARMYFKLYSNVAREVKVLKVVSGSILGPSVCGSGADLMDPCGIQAIFSSIPRKDLRLASSSVHIRQPQRSRYGMQNFQFQVVGGRTLRFYFRDLRSN
ncbi:hypothetical protein C0J52_21835, partial [Blattella germanica]